MMFARIACLILLVFLSLGIRTARAGECNISGAHFQFASDTVEWRMRIVGGQSCVQTLRLRAVEIATIDLISAPKFGQVTLIDRVGFKYTAKSDLQGEDSFSLRLSGAIKGVPGTSTIRIVVSIVAAP